MIFLLLDFFRNSLFLKKLAIFDQILKTYVNIWSKNLGRKRSKRAILIGKWGFESLLLFVCPLFAEWSTQQQMTPPRPEQIEALLTEAEKEFNSALTIFNPWYTGPLITPSATMMPPGFANYQPYVFVSGTYAAYNSQRSTVSMPARIEAKMTNTLFFGITDTLDINATLSAFGQWQSGHSGGGFGDLPITIGFPICKQGLYVPQMKFTISELFPTGRYQHLNSNGLLLSATGQGSYQTTFGFAMSKLLFWSTQHPTNTRLFVGYTIPTPVHVRGFNAYGGGYGTKGTVRPGNTFITDLGLELSLTQSWVFACDFVYSASNKTTFHGQSGMTSSQPTASVGGGSNDNLSLAPAIEYSWGDNIGVLAGAWFSVYGRNSSAFAQGIISFSYTFPIHSR